MHCSVFSYLMAVLQMTIDTWINTGPTCQHEQEGLNRISDLFIWSVAVYTHLCACVSIKLHTSRLKNAPMHMKEMFAIH